MPKSRWLHPTVIRTSGANALRPLCVRPTRIGGRRSALSLRTRTRWRFPWRVSGSRCAFGSAWIGYTLMMLPQSKSKERTTRKVAHLADVAGTVVAAAGLLRDFRSRLFGQRQDCQSSGLRRRRPKLGRGGTATAGAEHGVHALSHALAMEWRPSHSAKPCLGRRRQRAADAGAICCRAEAAPGYCIQRHRPELPRLMGTLFGSGGLDRRAVA